MSAQNITMEQVIGELILKIKDNRCVLLLGPLMKTFEENGKWVSHNEEYCANLQTKLGEEQVVYDLAGAENPYYLRTKYLNGSEARLLTEHNVFRQTYSKSSNIYEKLARLPFHTIINFGFDDFMPRALKKNGYEYKPYYYNYQGVDVSNIDVSNDMLLVYNLLGHWDKKETMAQTLSDQLVFHRKINSSPKLPDNLKTRFRSDVKGQKAFIFMGFDFKEWPVPLILDMLDIPKANLNCTISSECDTAVITGFNGNGNVSLLNDIYSYCFGINIVKWPVEEFVTALVNAYPHNDHQFGHVLHVEPDLEVKNGFYEHLVNSNLVVHRKIAFFNRDDILPDQIPREVILQSLEKASVFILFISNKSINDSNFRNDVNRIIARKKAQVNENDKAGCQICVFPVIVRNCDWENVFPDLREYATIILPGENKNLLSSSKTRATEEDFLEMLSIINSKTR